MVQRGVTDSIQAKSTIITQAAISTFVIQVGRIQILSGYSVFSYTPCCIHIHMYSSVIPTQVFDSLSRVVSSSGFFSIPYLLQKWEEKAGKAKEEYTKAMKEYKESGGGAVAAAAETKESKGGPSKPKKKKTAEVATGRTSGGGGDFKSKEYISDSGSSDEDKKKDKKVELWKDRM